MTDNLLAKDHLLDLLDQIGDKMEPDDAEPSDAEQIENTDLITEDLTPLDLEELASTDIAYALSLRILMLRIMVRTPALGKLKNRCGYTITVVCNFLGFKNFEKYVRSRTIAELQEDLGQILRKWESEHGTQFVMPEKLSSNLNALATVVGLNDLEKKILGFTVLLQTEAMLENCSDLLGSDLVGFSIERIIAPILNENIEQIRIALDRSSTLSTTGLLSIDPTGRFGLRHLLDLLTPSFATRMLSPQQDIRKIVEGFVKSVPPATLTTTDYLHIDNSIELCKDVLSYACANNQTGVNILICGKPGTGKSEFVRLLAEEIGVELMEISSTNSSGAPVSPVRRLRNYRIAQSFFRGSRTALLFDECEEVLNPMTSLDRGEDEEAQPRKSWINKTLETNVIPTIWVANSIKHFDEAYIRRFSVCFEMPVPSEAQRLKIVRNAFGQNIDDQILSQIAHSTHATPAIVSQTAAVICSIAKDKDQSQCGEMAYHLINEKLKAQGKPAIPKIGNRGIGGIGFDPSLVNTDTDLKVVCESLVHSRSGKICLYGVPGTGKTSFGKWVAQCLEAPHLSYTASDLLGAHVGETEQNIAHAFEKAKEQNAVLQFDEVDSFLQDRSKASRTWEITQVNQMLLEIENFDGIFIASTNLVDNLDEASLRRFDMTIKLDYLKADAAWDLFVKTCQHLGLALVNDLLKPRLAALTQLTPGDFDQLVRRAKLLRPQSAESVIKSLDSACRLKKSGASKAIGFLAA